MFGQLEIFQLAQARAQHAGARQAKIATNIAHADTPGYRAEDIKPFLETYRAEGHQSLSAGTMRTTRSGHSTNTGLSVQSTKHAVIDRPSGGSPSGNTVSLEIEMLEAIDADRAHNRAVTIYETALGILRSALRSGR